MNNKIINIETIREYILNKKVYWTNHCLNRINQRNISVNDIKNAINNGNIIEYYYKDYPYPSCLIMGRKKDNRIIHIVCGISEEYIYIITAYHPDTEKWETNLKYRRDI